MSDEAARIEAAILWFDARTRQGAVETDDGRFLRFLGRSFPFVPEPGRKVEVALDPSGRTVAEQVVVRPLRERVVVPLRVVTVAYALKERPRGLDRPVGVEPKRGVRVDEAAAAEARRARKGPKRAWPARRPGEAFGAGASVRHGDWGQGFVIMSSERVARVRFSGQERTVRVDDLHGLDD